MEFISIFNVSVSIFPTDDLDVFTIIHTNGQLIYSHICWPPCSILVYVMDENWNMIGGDGSYLFISQSFPFCNKCDSTFSPNEEHVSLFYLQRVRIFLNFGMPKFQFLLF